MSDHRSKADKGRRFKYLRWLLGLLGVPLLASLGYWQLQRAEQKQHWLEQQEALPMTRAESALKQLEYQAWVPVKLLVELLPDKIFLLDNRTLKGRVGYEVIVPVRVDEGSLWLASLGWVQASSQRERLPVLNLQQQRLQVEGMLAHPTRSITLGDAPAELGWPRRIQTVDLERISQALDQRVEPALLHLSTRINEQIIPRSNVQIGVMPQRHMGYAVQWFALALTLVLWLVWASRPDKGVDDA